MLRGVSSLWRIAVREPRPPVAPRRKIRRNTKRIIGLTTAVGMAAALSAPSAFAAPSDDSEAEAHLINLDLNALGLDLDVLDAITTASGYPSEEGPNSAAIDVGVLNALGITLPGISLPLIGDGDNGGLLDLGDQAAAGLLNGYAASPSEVESLAASGAVGADGAIDVDAGSSTDPARVDLTGLLGQVGVDGLTDAIIDELSLELGALASRAEANEGDISREYLLAGAELVVSSPLVGGLAGEVQGAVEDISDGINALLGPEGAIQGALDVLSIDPITISVPLVGDVLSVDIGAPQLSTTVDLGNITDGLLTEPLVSENGLVSIDLSTGEIRVDLAMLHQGNLNEFLPNTELLSAGEVAQIVETAKLLLGEAVDLVTEAVQDALNDTELTLTIDPELEGIGGVVNGELDITLTGTLADFTGQSEDEPDVDVTGTISVGGVSVPIGTIAGALVSPILTQLVPGIGSALSPLLDDASGVVADVVDPLISGVTGVLDPVMTDLLNEIISITVNKQDDGADATDWHTVSALNIALLPLLDDVVELDLAHSAVRALDEDDVSDASIEVAPGSVEIGDTITVDGSGFAPDSSVTITFTDAEGNVVGNEEVTTDADGNFSGAEFVVPEDTAIGELAVVASDGESEAESSTTVVDDDGSDEDGSDQDGGDQDGSDEDGSDQDGGDQDGADQDGGDQDGSDQDGADQDGSDQDGTTPPVTDPGIDVTPDEAAPGDTVTVEGDGFPANTDVTVTFTDSAGNVVGTVEVTTDDDGAFTTDFVIPDGTAAGELAINASDGTNEADAAITITAAQKPGASVLPRTGAEMFLYSIVALLAIIGGMGMISVRKMKKRTQ